MLEATFGGVSLAFEGETKVAITGAAADLYVDDLPMPLWETIIVPAGATLSVSIPTKGLYSYISVAGGIQVPDVLGSKSTHLGSSLGGYDGRALSEGDVMQIGDDSAVPTRPRGGTMAPQDAVLACDDIERRIRVLSGSTSSGISITTR